MEKIKNTGIFFIYSIPLFFLPFSTLGAMRSKKYLLLSFIFLSILLWSIKFLKEGRFFISDTGKFRIAFLFIAVSLLSLVFSEYILTSAVNTIVMIMGVICVLLPSISTGTKYWEKYKKHIFLSGLFPVILSIIPAFHFGSDNIVSTFGNQNFLSAYILICLSCYVWFKKRYFSHIISAVYVFAIIFSGSRNALLGLLVLITIHSYKRTARKKLFSSILIMLICAAGLILVLKPDLAGRISSIEYRIYLYRISVHRLTSFADLMIGNGPGTYKSLAYHDQIKYLKDREIDNRLSTVRNNISHAHNEYYQMVLEYGVLILIPLFLIIRIIFRTKRSVKYDEGLPVLMTLMLSLFSFPMHNSAVMLVNILALQNLLIGEGKSVAMSFRHKKTICVMLTIIALLMICRFVIMPVSADVMFHYFKAENNDDIMKAETISSFMLNRQQIYQHIAFLYSVERNIRRSEVFLKKAGKYGCGPKITALWGYLAELKGKTRTAMDHYRDALLGSRDYRFPVLRGLDMSMRQGDFQSAIELLSLAWKLDREKKDLLTMAELQFNTGDKEQAEKSFDILVNILDMDTEGEASMLRGVYFRLFQLTGNREYIKKMNKIESDSYIEDIIKEADY